MFGAPKGLLRRCLGVQTPTHKVIWKTRVLPTQTMQYYKGKFSKMTIHLHCLIPPKRGKKSLRIIRVQSKLVGGSTPLKNISQIGNLPQIGMKIKNI